MKKTLLMLATVVVSACSIGDEDGNNDYYDKNLPYYKFVNVDADYLIDSSLKKGKTITFKNQDGETLKYKVNNNYSQRSNDASGTFSGGSGLITHYYDVQRVHLEAIDFPYDYATMSFEIRKNASNELHCGFYFHLYNGYNTNGSIYQEHFNLKQSSTTSLTIGSKIFDKVIVLDSNSDVPYDNVYPRNVSRVYYQPRKGVIGFDDLDNKQWRIVL